MILDSGFIFGSTLYTINPYRIA